MNEILLTGHLSRSVSLLSPEDRLSLRKYLSLLKENPLSGLRLWGAYSGLYAYETTTGLQIIYKILDGTIYVVAIKRAGRHAPMGEKKVSAVVLAAGKSKDQDIPRIIEITETFSNSSIDEIILVLGYRAEAVKERLKGENIRVVVNQNYEGVLSRSLRCGLRVVAEGASAVFLALGNQNPLNPAVIKNLLEVYRMEGAPIVAPSYKGRRLHPVIFDRALLPELLRVKGNVGGREVLYRHEGELREVHIANQCHINDTLSFRRSLRD